MKKTTVYYVIHHSYNAGTLYTSKVVNTMEEVQNFLQQYNDHNDINKEYTIDKITMIPTWYGKQTTRETIAYGEL